MFNEVAVKKISEPESSHVHRASMRCFLALWRGIFSAFRRSARVTWLQSARAGVPCSPKPSNSLLIAVASGPTLAADVQVGRALWAIWAYVAQVGDVSAKIGPSRTILHLEVEERDCAIVTFGYEGRLDVMASLRVES